MPDTANPWPAHAVAGEGTIEWTALLLPPGRGLDVPRCIGLGAGFFATDRVHLGSLEDQGELLRLQFTLERRIDHDLDAAPRELWFVFGPRVARAQTRRVELVVQGQGIGGPWSAGWSVS
jgi:hypothetical protein